MKMKIFAAMLSAAMAVTFTACSMGGLPENEAPSDAAENEELYLEEDIIIEEETGADILGALGETAAAVEEISLLDVTPEMINAGLFARDEEGTELLLSMFTLPSGTPVTAMSVTEADGTGSIVCGAYEAEIVTDPENKALTYTYMTFIDVFTGTQIQLAAIESEADGSCSVMNGAGDIYTAEYLSSEETVDRMTAAVKALSD